ncbi:hypothetical protein JHK85_012461 [Glycine max]|nr:hypothetical protein JHK85_012461 [Glycine max]
MVGHIGWGRTQVINQNEPMLNVKNKITEFPRSGRMEVMARLLAAETFSHTVVASAKKNPDSSSPSPWRDLLDNPMQ